MKTALLVGGAGFIGHNLAIKLKKEKKFKKVIILDFLKVNNIKSGTIKSNLYKKILKERLSLLKKNKIKLHLVDSRNYKTICKYFKKYNPSHLYHLAAIAHANISNKDPFSTFDHSLRTLENSLDASRALKNLNRFIYISSSMVYGNFTKPIVNEKDICNPLGIYGSLKYAGEKMVQSYNQVFGLKYNIIRPSALYGERCVSRRVVQVFVENAIMKKPLNISGDGLDKLDFTHIEDLTECLAKLANNKKIHENKIFNITFGNSRSINDVVKILRKEIGKVEVNYKKRDKLMPFRGTLSNKEAKKYLNFKPKCNLEVGIKNLVKWYKKNHLDQLR